MNVKNGKLTYYNSFEFIRLITVSLNVANLLTQVIAFGNRFQCLATATKKTHIIFKMFKLRHNYFVALGCSWWTLRNRFD